MIQDGETISVIVPTYNAEKTIDDTLLSVRQQTYQDLDIIIVDDGSTDGTGEKCLAHARADSRIRIVSQANGGVAAARNRGIAEARGNFVAPIDADDLWSPTKIARQVRGLRNSGPDVLLVYNWSAYIDDDGAIIKTGEQPGFFGDVGLMLSYGNFVGNGSTALMLKSAVEAVGGYDSSLRARKAQGCEDWSLFLRLADIGHFALIADFLTGYRQPLNAMSRDIAQMLKSDEIVRAELLARHPEYANQIKWGRRYYLEWMFRRELTDGNWSEAHSLFWELVRRDDSRSLSVWRAAKLSRLMALRVSRKSHSGGPPFLPSISP